MPQLSCVSMCCDRCFMHAADSTHGLALSVCPSTCLQAVEEKLLAEMQTLTLDRGEAVAKQAQFIIMESDLPAPQRTLSTVSEGTLPADTQQSGDGAAAAAADTTLGGGGGALATAPLLAGGVSLRWSGGQGPRVQAQTAEADFVCVINPAPAAVQQERRAGVSASTCAVFVTCADRGCSAMVFRGLLFPSCTVTCPSNRRAAAGRFPQSQSLLGTASRLPPGTCQARPQL